jgi:hypothetical protein
MNAVNRREVSLVCYVIQQSFEFNERVGFIVPRIRRVVKIYVLQMEVDPVATGNYMIAVIERPPFAQAESD